MTTIRDTFTAAADPHTLAEARRMAIEQIRRAEWERGEAALEDALDRMEAEDRQVGIFAAERYLSSHEIPETEPPFPWLYLVAVLAIVALLVAVCAISWDAIAAGVAFLAMSSAAGSSLVAEAGRDAGVVR